MIDLETYDDLLEALLKLTPEQRKQPIQLLPPSFDKDKPVLLEPVFSIGTVEELLHVDGEVFQEVRDVRDFTHRPEAVVLLRDGSPYSEEGDFSYELVETPDGYIALRGDRTGKLFGLHDKEIVE